MEVIFLGGFFPREYENKIQSNSKGAIANANNALQWAYIEGLKNIFKEDTFQLISLPQVGAYPFRYKVPFFKVESTSFGKAYGIKGTCINFLNVFGIKHLDRYRKVKKILCKTLAEIGHHKDILILVYDLSVPSLVALKNMKKIYPRMKICLIVPDIHGLTGEKNDVLHRMLFQIEETYLRQCYEKVDAYVLLSKYMVEKIPVQEKPYMVIEGIYQPLHGIDIIKPEKEEKLKVLFYSGALDERNGVHRLIEAFSLIKDPAFRLILCGDGELRNFVLSEANRDNRILYKGQLSREQVIQLQQSSTLLVNPRPAEGEFTRYSFPSKTMEYFASGVPVLMYRLEGIPDEYYQYCYTPKGNTVQDLKDIILWLCSQNENILKQKGEEARLFITEHKNSRVQCYHLLCMVKTLFQKA